MAQPLRTCVGCRTKLPQANLTRFVRGPAGWRADPGVRREPGRGAYLCSHPCAVRVAKNKRYPGLAAAAGTVAWQGRNALGEASALRV